MGESGFNAPSAFQDADLKRAFGENGAQAYRLWWRGDMDEADYIVSVIGRKRQPQVVLVAST